MGHEEAESVLEVVYVAFGYAFAVENAVVVQWFHTNATYSAVTCLATHSDQAVFAFSIFVGFLALTDAEVPLTKSWVAKNHHDKLV